MHKTRPRGPASRSSAVRADTSHGQASRSDSPSSRAVSSGLMSKAASRCRSCQRPAAQARPWARPFHRGRVQLAAGVPPRDVSAVDRETVVFAVGRGGAREHVRHYVRDRAAFPARVDGPGYLLGSQRQVKQVGQAGRVPVRRQDEGPGRDQRPQVRGVEDQDVRCFRDDDLVIVNRADPVWRGDVVGRHAVGGRECRPQRPQLRPGNPARWVGEPAQQLIRAAGLGQQGGEGRADPERASDRGIRQDAGERRVGVRLARPAPAESYRPARSGSASGTRRLDGYRPPTSRDGAATRPCKTGRRRAGRRAGGPWSARSARRVAAAGSAGPGPGASGPGRPDRGHGRR